MDAKDLTLIEFVDLMCQDKGFKLQPHHKEFLKTVEETHKGNPRLVIYLPRRRLGMQFLNKAIGEYYGNR